MKAYKVFDSYCDDGCSTVVFAGTANKARYLALSTVCCCDGEYKDIKAYRQPTLDKYYKENKTEMDWYDGKDRIALVKAGWCCLDEECDLDECPAKEFCRKFND